MASKFLTVAKLLRSSHRSPFAGRLYFSSSSSTPENEPWGLNWAQHFRSVLNSSDVIQVTMIAAMKHPFMTQGLSAMGYVEQHVSTVIVKIDMPGIGKEGLKIRLKRNEIHIEGDAEKENDGLVRRYCGVLDVPQGFYNTDDIKASITLGVLKLVIPKLRPTVNAVPPIEFRGWGPMYSGSVPILR